MKHLRPLILGMLFTLAPFVVDAQPQELLEAETIAEMSDKIESTTLMLSDVSVPLNLAKKPMKGSYLNSAWSPAVVYSKSKEFLSCVARYNIHKDRMEIKVDENLRAIQIHNINGVIIDGSLFIPLSSEEMEDGDKPRFFKVLADGNLTLLSKYKLSLHTSGGTALYANIGSAKEYRSSEELYYCQDGEKAHKLQKGKKNILQLFESKKADIEKFAKDNGLGFRKEKDLAELFDYYNK